MNEEEASYTAQEVQAYTEEILRQQAQEKANLHGFFTKVIQHPSTTRIGNVTSEELGNPQLTIRGLKELQLFCKDVYMDEEWADYFDKLAEIQTSTSLSKDALLLNLAVTNKKEMADMTPKAKVNKGWFKKKSSSE